MSKKICIITTVSSTIKSFLIDTMDYLQKNGYEITVICNNDDSLQDMLPTGIRYIPISMSRGVNFKDCIVNIFRLIKIFKAEKFDLVQYSTPNASLYASIASYIARIPVRLYCQWGIVYVGFEGIKRKIFKVIEKLVCTLSTQVEPDSFGNLKFSHSEGLYSPNKSTVIWNGSASGVDLKKFNIENKEVWRNEIRSKYNIDNDTFVFGFIGRLNRDKGINELLAAYKSVYEKLGKVILLIVGPEDRIEEIDRELYTWSLNNKSIIYCGRVNEVEKYYSAMDTFILPSYREGFGSVVIESEAMGTPVIVSNIPGPTDAMLKGKTGLLVKKGDASTLVNAMEYMINNEDVRSNMSKEANKFVTENFEKNKLLNFILEDRNRLTNGRKK